MQYISCIVEKNDTMLFLIITEEKESQNGIGRVIHFVPKDARGLKTESQEFLVFLWSGAN